MSLTEEKNISGTMFTEEELPFIKQIRNGFTKEKLDTYFGENILNENLVESGFYDIVHNFTEGNYKDNNNIDEAITNLKTIITNLDNKGRILNLPNEIISNTVDETNRRFDTLKEKTDNIELSLTGIETQRNDDIKREHIYQRIYIGTQILFGVGMIYGFYKYVR